MQELEGELEGGNLTNWFCHGSKCHMPNIHGMSREAVAMVITSLSTLFHFVLISLKGIGGYS